MSKPGFDLRTAIRNPKTGQVVKHQPYRLYKAKNYEVYERPVGSGNVYFADGEPAGRMEHKLNSKGAIVSSEFKAGAEHVAWVPPTTENSAEVIREKDATIGELQKRILELEAKQIAAEKGTKTNKPEIKTSKDSKDVLDGVLT